MPSMMLFAEAIILPIYALVILTFVFPALVVAGIVTSVVWKKKKGKLPVRFLQIMVAIVVLLSIVAIVDSQNAKRDQRASLCAKKTVRLSGYSEPYYTPQECVK